MFEQFSGRIKIHEGANNTHSFLEGVDGHFGCYMFYLNLHEKGSKCNHQSSQDWNDLEVA